MGTEWFKDAIIYQVFIDRFAGYNKPEKWEKSEFIGGNIRGIIDKFHHFEELGINTIWISPFYKTTEYHGYQITDYFDVEPRFGKMEEIEELIKLVHDKGMKIIADFIPNHCSSEHPSFMDARENFSSEYHDWFHWEKWPDKYWCFFGVRELPKLNLENKKARQHIIDAAIFWLDKGFDGFRLDYAIGPSHRFWKEFNTQIKKDFPDAVLIGEVWLMGVEFSELKKIGIKKKLLRWIQGKVTDGLQKEYIGELDGLLDFRFMLKAQELLGKKNKVSKFKNFLKNHYKKFPENYYLPTFLDNHDANRFFLVAGNNKEKLKLASTIQFQQPHPPIIYYGTEVGINQDHPMGSFYSHGDLQVRKPMPWDKQDKEILEHYKQLIQKRKLLQN